MLLFLLNVPGPPYPLVPREEEGLFLCFCESDKIKSWQAAEQEEARDSPAFVIR